MGRGSPLPETHDCIKDVVTKALEHYVKPLLVNTVLFANGCLRLHFTQRPLLELKL